MGSDGYLTDDSQRMASSEADEDVDINDDFDEMGGTTDNEDDILLETGDEEEFMQSTSLSTKELENLIASTVDDVSAFLQITSGMAKALLKQFDWNKEQVLEKFFEGCPSNSVEQSQATSTSGENHSKKVKGECQVCYDDCILTVLPCGHSFCKSCLKDYITTKVMSDNVLQIQCLATDCKTLIGEDLVIECLNQCAKKVKTNFSKLENNSFVASSPHMTWCPGWNCGKVVKVTSLERKPAKCSSCRKEFCFKCKDTWHAPAECAHLKLWEKKCAEDGKTCNWMNKNTRDCPKCGVPIEKNGGCNHMKCTNSTCKTDFCWLCLSVMGITVNHSCTRSEEKDKDKKSARTSLQRYLHHYNRYMNHQKSLKLEGQLYQKVSNKVKMIQMVPYHNEKQYERQLACLVEPKFLTKAVDVLNECRRTLMYSYVLAFYLEKNNHSYIFEDNQQDLENATEHLSKALEQDLFDDEQNFTDLKRTIQTKALYVAKRRLVMLEHVNDLPDNAFESEINSKENGETPIPTKESGTFYKLLSSIGSRFWRR